MSGKTAELLYIAQERLWTSNGFDADKAVEWMEAGFSLRDAIEWRDFGFEPSQAEAWIKAAANMHTRIKPVQARLYVDAGNTPADYEIAIGFQMRVDTQVHKLAIQEIERRRNSG